MQTQDVKQIARAAWTRQTGYSLLELIVVVGLVGMMGSMAVVQISASLSGLKGEGAMRVAIAQLNVARDMSIAQRREIQVSFVGANQIQVVRQDEPNRTTVLSTVSFEDGVQFALVRGVPDTPEGLGNSHAVSFGAAQKILFESDGTVVDQDGNPLNGTVFTAIPTIARSARAVTLIGAVGRITGYRWNGAQWVLR